MFGRQHGTEHWQAFKSGVAAGRHAGSQRHNQVTQCLASWYGTRVGGSKAHRDNDQLFARCLGWDWVSSEQMEQIQMAAGDKKRSHEQAMRQESSEEPRQQAKNEIDLTGEESSEEDDEQLPDLQKLREWRLAKFG